MIVLILGLSLLVLSVLCFSSLHSDVIHTYDVRRLTRHLLIGSVAFVALVIYTILSLIGLIEYNQNLAYIFPALFALQVFPRLLVDMYRSGGIELKKEGFECFIYALVLYTFARDFYVFIPTLIIAVLNFILVIIIFLSSFYLMNYSRRLHELVEFVEIPKFLKLVAFGYTIYGLSGVLLYLNILGMELLMIMSYIVIMVSFLYLLRDLMNKYVKPWKKYSAL